MSTHTQHDYTSDAVTAITAAVASQHDFCDWLASVLAQVAARYGSSAALTEGRPGSWEAALVIQLLAGTLGPDNELFPTYRERA